MQPYRQVSFIKMIFSVSPPVQSSDCRRPDGANDLPKYHFPKGSSILMGIWGRIFTGVLKFFWKTVWPAKTKQYCSAICTAAINSVVLEARS